MFDCLISANSFINLKVGVSLHRGALHFASSSSNILDSISTNNAHATNCHLHGSGESNEAQRRTKISFARTIMQVLELLQLAKRHVWGTVMTKNAKIL